MSFSQIPFFGVNHPYTVMVFGNEVCTTNIVINTNCILDIRGTLKMATGTRIVVQPGGILRIADGAIITHEDDDGSNTKNLDETWEGIILNRVGIYMSTDQQNDARKLCEGNFSACIGNADEWDNIVENNCVDEMDFNNSILIMDYGKIKYANVAVKVNYGGYLYVTNSEFWNNKTSCISFTKVSIDNDVRELSIIENNKFYTRLDVSGSYLIDNMISIDTRDFFYPIKYNMFQHDEVFSGANVYTKYGIKQLNSNVEIRYNKFQNLLTGLYNSSFIYKARVDNIKDNIFSNNYVGIWSNSTDNLILKNNVIYNPDYNATKQEKIFASIPPEIFGSLGVLEQEETQVFGYLNKISKGNANNENTVGITQVSSKFSNTSFSFQNSNYYKNTVSDLLMNMRFVNGLNAPLNKIITNSQYSCNTYHAQTTGDFFAKTQNDVDIVRSIITAQGSPGLSAGNIFSTPGYGNIYNGSYYHADNHIYFYDNQPNREPTVSNVIKNLTIETHGCANLTETYEVYKPKCSVPYMNPLDGGYSLGMSVLKGDMQTYRVDITNMELAGVDSSNQAEYDYTCNAYNINLLQLLAMYYDAMDADTNGTYGINAYYDSITSSLKNHATPFGAYHLLGISFERADYNDVRAYADSMLNWFPQFDTNMQELKNYIELLTEYAETADSSKFLWMQDNFSTIKTIADDSVHFSSHKARVWVQYIADIDTTNEYHGFIMYPLNIPLPAMTEESTDEPEFVVTIYPNPFDEGLHVQVENQTDHTLNYEVKIYDFNGSLVGEQPLTIDVSNTETADFNTNGTGSGYYFVRIFEDSSEIHYALIYK